MDDQNFQNDPVTQSTESTQENFYQDNTEAVDSAQPTPVYYTVEEQPKQQTSALAVVGLVMGIVSILFSCCYGLGIFFGIAGIICSALSKKKSKSGIGTAGLICSIIGTVFSVIMIIYVVAVAAMLVNDPEFMNSFTRSYY